LSLQTINIIKRKKLWIQQDNQLPQLQIQWVMLQRLLPAMVWVLQLRHLIQVLCQAQLPLQTVALLQLQPLKLLPTAAKVCHQQAVCLNKPTRLPKNRLSWPVF
jgi:hypothetical protein